MIDSFGNIPSHPLLVHIPVVLVPLSMLATLLMVIIPGLRRRYGSLAIAVLALACAGSFVAARSGRSLEREYTAAGQTIPDLLRDHADMGNRLQFLVAIYLILSIVWIVRSRRSVPIYDEDGAPARAPQIVSVVIVVLVLVSGSLSTLSTLRTGQSGARSVWEQVSID
jgi:uncharacterized membrane protein